MQLQRLIGLEIEKLNKEYTELNKKIEEYNILISNEKELDKYIKKDLRRIRDKYKTHRKTEIDNLEIKEIKQEIIEEDVYVLIDRFNYLKIIDEQSYVRVDSDTLKEYKEVINIKNTDNLCLFTDNGDFHQIKIVDVPISKMKDRGTPLDNLCDIEKNEVLLITPLKELTDKVILITLKGLVKQVEAEEYYTIEKYFRNEIK